MLLSKAVILTAFLVPGIYPRKISIDTGEQVTSHCAVATYGNADLTM